MNQTRLTRKKKKKKRVLRSFAFLILVIFFGGASYLAYDIVGNAKKASNNIYQELDKNKLTKHGMDDVKVSKDPFTILLVGIENQEGGKGRSDVTMLLTVNPQKEEIYMLSIPRDTRTYIPEMGQRSKIAHSYGHGGIESTISALNEMIDVPIDYYITTNFDGFEDVVDTLDGVKVQVPFTFKAQLTGSLKWKTYHEGDMYLNGNEALAYVRMRKSDPKGDMGRNERQQQVIKEIVDKATSFSSITKIDDIMDDLGENVKTNIPPSKFLGFVKLYTQLKDNQIQQLKLDGYDEYINSVYYYIPRDESISELNVTLKHALEKNTSTASDQSSSPEDTASSDEDY